MRFSSCFRHGAWCSAAVMVVLRRFSSGSVSNSDEPSSTRPRRLVAPAAKRRASATIVLPVPPCPTTATFRILATSSAAIWTSVRPPFSVSELFPPRRRGVARVDEAEPVERQELVDGLDGGRRRRDERGGSP